MTTGLFIIFQVLVLVYSVVIHEVSHGLAANAMGDDTAKNLGRLTLNPIKHLDLYGSVLLPIFLIALGSPFIFGYAKPVPYDPRKLNDHRYGPAKVAVAGPLSNIVLALLFGLTLRFIGNVFVSPVLFQLLSLVVVLNLVLAIFNLFPIPPLDGHWLLMTLLPSSYNRLKLILYQYSLLFLLIFTIFIFPIISRIIPILFELITGVAL